MFICLSHGNNAYRRVCFRCGDGDYLTLQQAKSEVTGFTIFEAAVFKVHGLSASNYTLRIAEIQAMFFQVTGSFMWVVAEVHGKLNIHTNIKICNRQACHD
jgi:hypothetical protein